MAVVEPRPCLREGQVKDPGGETVDEAGSLEYRDEVRGPDESSGGVLPPAIKAGGRVRFLAAGGLRPRGGATWGFLKEVSTVAGQPNWALIMPGVQGMAAELHSWVLPDASWVPVRRPASWVSLVSWVPQPGWPPGRRR
jgi:hypothetical protein